MISIIVLTLNALCGINQLRDKRNMSDIKKSTKQSYTSQMKDILIEKIRNLEPGEKIPSERDLAETYEISRTTTRNAISSLIHEGFLTRLRGSGTFVTNKADETIQKGSKLKNIAFIRYGEDSSTYSITKDIFWFEVLEGIQKKSANSDYHLFFYSLSQSDVENPKTINDIQKRVDGIIIAQLKDKILLKNFQSPDVPVVLISPRFEGIDLDTIYLDNYGGAFKAASYLAEAGHKEIAIINGPTNTKQAMDRLKGYKTALKDYGIEIKNSNIAGGLDWDTQFGVDAMEDLLSKNSNITAVLCANDILASGAMQVLKNKGIIIPGEISIIGFDDTKLSTLTNPALTTIHVPKREIGEFAANRLFERITTPELPTISVTISTSLIERNSCIKL